MSHKITPEIENYAHEVKEKYGVPESITLAQAIYESSLGKSNLAQKNNNWFGIKSSGGWAKYDSARDSFLAYGKLLSKDRYNTGEFIGNSDDDTTATTSDNSSLVGNFLSGIIKYIMIAVLVVIMVLLMVFAFTPQRG